MLNFLEVLRRLSSRLLREVFSAAEPESPRLSLTPGLLELHQVQILLYFWSSVS